jgi:hypothetical protein
VDTTTAQSFAGWMMACFILHNFNEEDRTRQEAVEAPAKKRFNSSEDNDNTQEFHEGEMT